LPNETIPEIAHDFLGQCDGGGYCVPDEYIETGGLVDVQTCTSSVNDSEGRCVSLCVPQVADFAGFLREDGCRRGERCVPCINPLDGTNTGVCEIEFGCDLQAPGDGDGGTPLQCPYEGEPLVDPQTLDPCGECGAAHCLAEGLIPQELKPRLAGCDGGASGYCVPDEFIISGGQSVPESCDSVGGAEGRCLSRCLPEVLEFDGLLPQGACDPGELCVPCTNPLDGELTGACDIACDPGPSEEPVVFESCCAGRGTCVPSEFAGDNAALLGADGCDAAAGQLCAPNEYIDGPIDPPVCNSTFFLGEGGGRCISECIPMVQTLGFILPLDGCTGSQRCVPCAIRDPILGIPIPTGACDL
jgi:hypothetical protein